jgi:DNA-binding Lrp family transcriptional regulator
MTNRCVSAGRSGRGSSRVWEQALLSRWGARKSIDRAFASGALDRVAHLLGIASEALWRRLRRGDERGLIRPAAVVDLRGAGFPHETVVHLRLRDYSSTAMNGLEAALRADPHVTRAVSIAGAQDYQLACLFRDVREADRWARDMRIRPELAEVRQAQIHTRWGFGVEDYLLPSPPEQP